jgi:putative transposase
MKKRFSDEQIIGFLREAVHWWMIEYNEERPHGSLGDLTLLEYRQNHDRNSRLELST